MNCLHRLIRLRPSLSSCLAYGPAAQNKISTTNVRWVKKFTEGENEFAHQIFVQNPKYLNIVRDWPASKSEPSFEEKADFSTLSTHELCNELEKAANHCHAVNVCVSDAKFDGLVDAIVQNADKFTDDELIQLLKCLCRFPETPSPRTRNYLELWTALNDTCVNRIRNWKIDQLLLVADHWYALNLSKLGKFTWQALRKVSRNIRRLRPHQLVQTMFFINMTRKGVENMIDFEISLDAYMDQLTLDEISVLCVGFFKTKTPLRQVAVIERLYRRLIREADTAKDIALTNILKTLRYSSTIPLAPVIDELLDKFVPQIPRLSLLSCLHLALLGTNFQKCHDVSLELIIRRFENELSTARLKDIERICFAMGLFDKPSHQLCEQVLEEVKTRISEIARHPKCFASCLHYLSMCGHASGELISAVLTRQFIKDAYGQNFQFVGREIFCLDMYTRINLKGRYGGNQLSDNNRRVLAKFQSHFVPQQGQPYRLALADKLLLEVEEAVQRQFGKCRLMHALPHFEKPDIVMLYDRSTKKASTLDIQSHKHYSGEILDVDALMPPKEDLRTEDDLKIVSIIVAGWNAFVRDTERPTGLLKMKMEQLKLIGHAVVLVPWNDWTQLDPLEKEKYLSAKVTAAVEQSTFYKFRDKSVKEMENIQVDGDK